MKIRTDWMKATARTCSALALLAVCWVMPPALHKALHYCPLRPDGVGQAHALPAFSRKYKLSCSQCHSGFPALNAYGRQFKMNGYVREPGGSEGVLKSQDQELTIEAIFPWALIVRSRPFDNGTGTISNQGAQMGGTASPNSNGFKSQPLNDVDFFVAGGDAARHISFFGEMDANANSATSFQPALGDLRLGYHPLPFLNVVAARRGFFGDDPYQTIVSNETPTIANRATDLLMNNQSSISGNSLLMTQQAMYAYGQANLSGDAFLYYAAGASKDSDGGNQYTSPTNGNARLAFDNGKGLMVGTFGTYGHERVATAGGIGGNLGVDNGTGERQLFQRGGFDALWEIGNLTARAAFVYSHDRGGDPASGLDISDTNRAAYAELAYYYKRGHMYPFLAPLVRENWYTTFNGTRQFNYVTMQLAHYFAPNLKAFIEYSVDTKRDYQGGQLNNAVPPTSLASLGDRVTMQLEVGF
ncbi:MAG: hypothetical protein NTY77_08515 [Elusimicrobia bacterium]|nr:hypothetical protein [Elusimicrobiota bacterium]